MQSLSFWQRLHPWHWFKRHGWQLFITGITLLIAYSIYLDAQILKKFNGNKWQVPAQVYARPLTLSVGVQFSAEELIEELNILSYRDVGKAKYRGEYHHNRNSVELIRRSFHYAGSFNPQQRLRITFNSGKIRSIRDTANNIPLAEMMLEPWLVTRLVSAEREDRLLLSADDVSTQLTEALLLIEDNNFYQHYGVAPLSILRALKANIVAGKTVQGGSTLTQQLVKNMFLTREKVLIRKVNEALMALLIEWRFTKDEILMAYLNEVYLGQNGATAIHGFGLASRFYFDRPLNELNIAETATLVAMVKGPSYYNPRRRPDEVITRRNLVLRKLFEAQQLDRFEYETWLASPLKLAASNRFQSARHPAFMQRVRRELSQVLTNQLVNDNGVKVYTSLSPLLQRKLERSVIEQLSQIEAQKGIADLQSGAVISDYKSGEIRAIVGAREVDFKGFNRAVDAKRMIGSLIKPAVFLAALERPQQYHLMTPLADEAIEVKTENQVVWRPQNYDKTFRGQVPLVDALVNSWNVPTVNLGLDIGLEQVARMVRRLGVSETVQPYPALTLGAITLSPLQVNQMYQSIANQGVRNTLHTLTAVTTADDRLLWQNLREGTRVADSASVSLLNYGLHKVTTEGTAKGIEKYFPRINMAGKTGTTDDYRDSWYSGYDKDLLFTAWLGKDDNSSTGLTGSSGALSLYLDFQQRRRPKSLHHAAVPGVAVAHFDRQSGKPVPVHCATRRSVPAITAGLSPVGSCEVSDQPGQEQSTEEKSFWQRILGR